MNLNINNKIIKNRVRRNNNRGFRRITHLLKKNKNKNIVFLLIILCLFFIIIIAGIWQFLIHENLIKSYY